MKYRPEIYAKALAKALAEQPASQTNILKRFVRLLSRSGDLGQSQQVLSSIEKTFTTASGGRMVEVDFAHEPTVKTKQRVSNLLTAKDHVDYRINPNLIAGLRVTIDGCRELDNSFSRKLRQIFN